MIFIASCSQTKIKQIPSKGQNTRIQNLVLHFTAQNYKQSLFMLKESGVVSAHYLIPRLEDNSYPDDSLQVLQLVDESQRAWHAGLSHWQNRNNLNDTSIGIEIVNQPICNNDKLSRHKNLGGEFGPERECEFVDFEERQIELLIQLAKDILKRNPDIHPTRVVGHADIALGRKSDPGPKFPWQRLAENGIGAWYDLDTFYSYQDMFEDFAPSVTLVQRALATYGYKVRTTGVVDQQTKDALYAFQLHFIPDNLSQQVDVKTSAVLFALIEKHLFGALPHLLKPYFQRADFERNYLAKQAPRLRKVAFNNSTEHFTYTGRKGMEKLTIQHRNLVDVNLSLSINGQAIPDSLITSSSQVHKTFNLSSVTSNGKNLLTVRQKNITKNLDVMVTSQLPEVNYQSNNKGLQGFTKRNGYVGSLLIQQYGETLHYHNSNPGKVGYASSSLPLLLAVLKLSGDGLIEVNHPIEYYLPEYQASGREYRRVIDLLEHTTGYGPINKSEHNGLLDGGEWLLTQAGFTYPVNEVGIYSRLNEDVLQLLVERLSGQKFRDYIEKYFFKPLQIKAKWQVNKGLARVQLSIQDTLTLLTLLQDQGVIADNRYFNASSTLDWLNNISFLSPAINAKSPFELNECFPASSKSSWLLSLQNGSMLYVDKEYDLQVVLMPELNFQYSSSSFYCGLTAFQTDLLNKVYLQVWR